MDLPYQQLLRLASAVQTHRDGELQRQCLGTEMNVPVNPILAAPAAASTLSTAFEKYDFGEIGLVSGDSAQVPAVDMADDFNNVAFSEGLNLDMEWQDWDTIARDLDPSLDFWDMGGL